MSQISITELAEQYINFINQYKNIHIEIAADYLVMAAWLTYLKSRLLLPKEEKIENILFKLPKFLKLYNNNYRPIYHLENFILYLCINIHEL